MPSSSDVSVKTVFRPSVKAAADSVAHSEDVSLSEYINDLVADALIARNALKPDDAASILAERELIRKVRGILDALMTKDEWDEHVTLQVFDRIRNELNQLHSSATSGGFSGQVNRRIGALVRRRLGAHDRKIDGKPVMANVSRRAKSLIKTYTLLYRTPQELP